MNSSMFNVNALCNTVHRIIHVIYLSNDLHAHDQIS